MRGSVSEAFLGFPWCGWRWQREAGFNPALMDIQVLVGTREFPGAHSCGQKQLAVHCAAQHAATGENANDKRVAGKLAVRAVFGNLCACRCPEAAC
jgi:hypothetical protein